MSEATTEQQEETLVLITLKPETRGQVGLLSNSSDDDATFFARPYAADGTGCVVLVIPESDPRNRYNGVHMCASEFDVIEDNTPDTEESDLWVGIVSPDYFATGIQADGMVNGDDDSRTYFVTSRSNVGTGWVRLIVSDDDPRVATSGSTFYHQSGDGEGRRGWNVEERYITRLETTPEDVDPYPVGTEQPTEPTEVSVTLTETELEDKLRQAREEGARGAQQEHARWVDSLVEDAHEWANDNSLCSEFDRFMEDHDLPTRTREYRAEVTVTLDVEARDEDTAREIAREMVYNELPGSMDDSVVTTGCWRA